MSNKEDKNGLIFKNKVSNRGIWTENFECGNVNVKPWWVGGWMGGRESRVKDCLQQSKILFDKNTMIKEWGFE